MRGRRGGGGGQRPKAVTLRRAVDDATEAAQGYYQPPFLQHEQQQPQPYRYQPAPPQQLPLPGRAAPAHFAGATPPQDRNVICVFNLPSQVQDDELQAFFAQFGVVEKVYTIRDKQRTSSRCKGYAFVYYTDQMGALAAKDRAPGLKFHGRTLRIDYSQSEPRQQHEAPPSEVLCVFGLPGNAAEDEVREAFGDLAHSIARVDLVRDRASGRCKGYGFIYFPDVYIATSAKQICPVIMLRGHMVRVDFSKTVEPRERGEGKGAPVTHSFPRGARPCNVLGCFGLPRGATERDVLELFERFDGVSKVDLVGDKGTRMCKGYAFIYFNSVGAATQAYQACTQSGGPPPKVRGQIVRVDFSLTTAPPQTARSGHGSAQCAEAEAQPFQPSSVLSPMSPPTLPNDSFPSLQPHHDPAAGLHHHAGVQLSAPPATPNRDDRACSYAASGSPASDEASQPEAETLDLVSRLQVLTEAEVSPELAQLFPLPRVQLESGKWGPEYVKGYEESRMDLMRILDGYLRNGVLAWGPQRQQPQREPREGAEPAGAAEAAADPGGADAAADAAAGADEGQGAAEGTL
eukprot:TRINITY_DN12165_c0_g1_i2.p1 TRINITY_DN12165_c0_g1~~TRINITY_DN12165_c0_g1_i2.p1  ORF type:complete len:620 (+),score=149.73 TRINITY_DN12165_c0_g1_i2:140-1861(+)